MLHRLHLLGFSAFERSTLASCVRLAGSRQPGYVQVATPEDADFLVVDADNVDAVLTASAGARVGDAVFVGRHAPEGAAAWMPRPLDALLLLRELDAIVALRGAAAAADMPALPQALIVDDCEAATRHLAGRLQRLGLPSVAARTSGQALERLARQRFEFVFVDVELGEASELDGLALCRRLRRQPSPGAGDAVLVLVSAQHGEVDRVRGALAGADAYLGKPLDDDELSRLVSRPPRAAAPASH
ncbi:MULTISPECIES: two-component system response regulator [unclassified Rubrivivax]|uniref:response regulator n=1 Tax=unclassified Rubrivivax TaxID=2649762 RepID=UPI001E30066F|nr:MULTISPECIES: response regulator [unclassified Rubrivivax]MCC9596865.1 response regulator [Rubrivivax sp. JA1055]MCC9649021.1 response regulator [Rubrivivax sp. JA1029]